MIDEILISSKNCNFSCEIHTQKIYISQWKCELNCLRKDIKNCGSFRYEIEILSVIQEVIRKIKIVERKITILTLIMTA